MNRWLTRGATLVNEGRRHEADLRIVDGRIERIDPGLDTQPGEQVIEASGLWLLPGMIDDQVHFREPGFPAKGDIASESAAAVAGGITRFMDAPNTWRTSGLHAAMRMKQMGLKQVRLRPMAVRNVMPRAALLLALCSACAAAAEPPALQLPSRVQQGALVIGTALAGDQLSLGERTLRVDPDGRFAFGVGRDESGPLRLRRQTAAGDTETINIEVVPRNWKIERVDGVPQETVTPPPVIAARIAKEQAAVANARQRDGAESHFAGPFIWPTRGRISGVFGSQRIYNGEPRSPHSGLDVAAPTGTALKVPAAGLVTFARPDLYLTGGTVLIDHGHGVSSVLLHLSRLDVEVGQQVVAGQILGAVGATGRATGPHMHWGLNWFDVRLDPALLPGIASP
jgi:murein DD-endopeptidase MepM/ murein hydrolase activator NlpD